MGVITGKLRDTFNKMGAAFRFLYGPPDVDPRARLPLAVAYPVTAFLFASATSPLAMDPWMLAAAPIFLPLMKPLGTVFQVAINTVTADVEHRLGFGNDFNAPAQRPAPKSERQRPTRGFTIRF